MARVNISIPDALRQNMEGLNCNWSALAQDAFSHAVELEQLKGEGKDMEAGLARLRADKHRHSEREQALGVQNGMSWALETASYDELKEAVGSLEMVEQPELAMRWVNGVLDSTDFDLPGMRKNDVSGSYARGFLQGAADVLAKV